MSVAGGDLQDQVSLQIFLDFAEFGMMPKEAISSPRFTTTHIQDSFNPSPDQNTRMGKIAGIDMNSTDQSVIDNLTNRGHKVTLAKGLLAYPVVVYLDQATGISYAASQPTNTFRGKCCAALNTP
jgi:gamma-glutamyltranspeptidase